MTLSSLLFAQRRPGRLQEPRITEAALWLAGFQLGKSEQRRRPSYGLLSIEHLLSGCPGARHVTPQLQWGCLYE